MKHLGAAESSLLTDLLESAGLSIPRDVQNLLLRHLEWVLEWNTRINLTAIVDPSEAIRLHIVDSLLALPFVNLAPQGSLCDLGTGAGFPGVPLALASGKDAVLVDSVGKKSRVLGEFLASEMTRIHVSLVVVNARAEGLAVLRPAEFSVVTARALSQLGSVLELASPLLKSGGLLVALKGNVGDEELARANHVAGIVGMESLEVTGVGLPLGDEVRTVVTARRSTAPAEIRLPRRTGLAQRQPLL